MMFALGALMEGAEKAGRICTVYLRIERKLMAAAWEELRDCVRKSGRVWDVYGNVAVTRWLKEWRAGSRRR